MPQHTRPDARTPRRYVALTDGGALPPQLAALGVVAARDGEDVPAAAVLRAPAAALALRLAAGPARPAEEVLAEWREAARAQLAALGDGMMVLERGLLAADPGRVLAPLGGVWGLDMQALPGAGEDPGAPSSLHQLVAAALLAAAPGDLALAARLSVRCGCPLPPALPPARIAAARAAVDRMDETLDRARMEVALARADAESAARRLAGVTATARARETVLAEALLRAGAEIPE